MAGYKLDLNLDPADMEDLSVLAGIVKIAQIVFLIILMTTMANIDGKLYWVLNTFSIFP